MRSDNKIDKVLWDVCSLVNKVKDGDDKRLDALKWGLIVLVDKFVSNKNRKRRIFELINMESSYYFELIIWQGKSRTGSNGNYSKFIRKWFKC